MMMTRMAMTMMLMMMMASRAWSVALSCASGHQQLCRGLRGTAWYAGCTCLGLLGLGRHNLGIFEAICFLKLEGDNWNQMFAALCVKYS